MLKTNCFGSGNSILYRMSVIGPVALCIQSANYTNLQNLITPIGFGEVTSKSIQNFGLNYNHWLPECLILAARF